MKDRLYILRAPFEDAGQSWYCTDCAAMEGALLANPAWEQALDVRRMPFPRPRRELIDLIGEDNQSMPVLVMDAAGAPADAKRAGVYAILTDIRAIGRAIVARHGGVGPHP